MYFTSAYPAMHQEAAQLGYDGEIYRKMLHLVAMGYPVGFLLIPDPWGTVILIGLSLTALSLDWLRARSEAAYSFFERFFGYMMRRRERDVLGQGPVFNGATWVTVSFTLLVLLFPTDIAVVAFAVFMIGDAAAALIGRRIGRTQWLREGATVEGSLAFLLVSSAMGWLLVSGVLPWPLLTLPLHAVWIGCLASALLEASPLPVNDNLATPLGAALVIQGIMTIWPN